MTGVQTCALPISLPNGCSASRVTAALPIVQVPVGGGPPARSPHASLRLGVVDLEARPCPPDPPAPSTPAALVAIASQFRMQFPGQYFRSCNRIVAILRFLGVR
mgnify:CR=1 FL=1